MSAHSPIKPEGSPEASAHPIRVVTAASLFDGHDAAINVMRRILQSSGAEVIHLGHNRSVAEVVTTALQEDAHAIALSSYQGGHMEYFRYAVEELKRLGAGHVQVFGGGGGVIVPSEIEALQGAGVARIYSPEDGRQLGLQGMIDDLMGRLNQPIIAHGAPDLAAIREGHEAHIARAISVIEAGQGAELLARLAAGGSAPRVPVVGLTGTGGAGKSSLTDELVRRFRVEFPEHKVAILSVDPTKRRTGGALLGDRIRMNAIYDGGVFMRSLATRQANAATSAALGESIALLRHAGFGLIVVETAGIGQSDSAIVDLVDLSLYVMTSEYGAESQLDKIDMLDFADVVVLNKFDKRGAEDARRAVAKAVQRARKRFGEPLDAMPVYGTIASQFHDPGTNGLYVDLVALIGEKLGNGWVSQLEVPSRDSRKQALIPGGRERYLAEISDELGKHHREAQDAAELASDAYGLWRSLRALGDAVPAMAVAYAPEALVAPDADLVVRTLRQRFNAKLDELPTEARRFLQGWPALKAAYTGEANAYEVRGKRIEVTNHHLSLSGLKIPKVSVPRLGDWGELWSWACREGLPGHFPYTAGVFPYKRQGEDPTRMFAGEGTPERTNKRFHYLSKGQPAVRLSTAFDSVTLYGEDPSTPPDVYGKIGNSGVSVCSLDDAKKLYSGFDLLAPNTSVSMTINGPAPMVLAFYLNAVIDQACEAYLRERGELAAAQDKIRAHHQAMGLPVPEYRGDDVPEGDRQLGLGLLGMPAERLVPEAVYAQLKAKALCTVRGTVQADILKEDQAQNTCIFSTEFALRMMGDVQSYFIENGVRNFYSVSVSGYHIAEAGANPISQLAFTLSNGFTLVEYYLARGMKIDEFAPNLSFFFSNGLDPEYTVIGRVARRIWAVAMKRRYGASARSQMLKYHIQTSGRSLHAMEVDFNDIRTSLQALLAIYDNCNSLHTNAYDEAITTPTEASVRRAMAIQLIINRELGLAKNENPLQGAFIVEELTELVEEAVLLEFRRLADRGGVLGAMETMYQRGKIQEESLHYESLKHSGELPIVGVNTFLNPRPESYGDQLELIRSTTEEKAQQIANVGVLRQAFPQESAVAIAQLKATATAGGNVFAALMDAAKWCSLGQMSQALYEVGGRYRRNM